MSGIEITIGRSAGEATSSFYIVNTQQGRIVILYILTDNCYSSLVQIICQGMGSFELDGICLGEQAPILQTPNTKSSSILDLSWI